MMATSLDNRITTAAVGLASGALGYLLCHAVRVLFFESSPLPEKGMDHDHRDHAAASQRNNTPQQQRILSYLNVKSAGEAIRLALFVADLDFVDRRVSYAQIDRLRKCGYLPFGQVPALEVGPPLSAADDVDNDDDKDKKGTQVYAQSLAILRLVGRQGGLYPDAFQIQIDQVLEATSEIKNLFRPAWYGSVLGRHPVTSEPLVLLTKDQTQATIDALNELVLPVRFGMIERLLKRISAGPFICGSADRLCIADLDLYVFVEGLLDGTDAPPGISANVLKDCPRIKLLVESVAKHTRVSEWNMRQKPLLATDKEIDLVLQRGWA